MKKEWSKADENELYEAWARGPGDANRLASIRAIASRAVELHEADLRAKGGTLTAEQTAFVRMRYENGDGQNGHVGMLLDHSVAQGARVAALEQVDTSLTKGWDDGAEAMRAACWEALQGVLVAAGAHGLIPVAKSAIEGATP